MINLPTYLKKKKYQDSRIKLNEEVSEVPKNPVTQRISQFKLEQYHIIYQIPTTFSVR